MTDRLAIIGIDVGGTFTDIFFLNEKTRECRVEKVPTTPIDQSLGFIEGIRQCVGSDAGSMLASVVHGTTVGTNALLERKGAKTGLITTAGFRDVLEMRRRDRPTTWGLRGSFRPIISRDMRFEVQERVLADGTVRKAVDLRAVVEAAQSLLSAGAEGLAIMFVNSYANPVNERAAKEAVQKIWPNDHITVSSDILPELREFERASTTALNASLQPVVGRYVQSLNSSLKQEKFSGDVLIVQSNGGVMTPETACEIPIRTALSGPAAGVIAGAHIGSTAGFKNIITCDMGGTSFDVALVSDGQGKLTAQTDIDFGLVIRTPMIQITTIGAGGGSIAWVDRGGILQVGPNSAGADPGPACYGNGSDHPTVTDANVLLGRINIKRPIGGKIKTLNKDAAREAISKHIGEPLALGDFEAAEAIIRVANSKMAGAIRLVSIERGYDPRKFITMPFGGGGALHAGALVKEVGLAGALVPLYPGVTSAIGCVIADMRHDFVQTINSTLEEIDVGMLKREIKRLAEEGCKRLENAEIALISKETVVQLDMLYVGQTHTVSVPINPNVSETGSIKLAFEEAYRKEYGRLLKGMPIRLMNVRVSVIGRRPLIDLSNFAPSPKNSIKNAERPPRKVFFQGGWHTAKVYNRLLLPIKASIQGPAVLEQSDATTFIDPGLAGMIDDYGNILIERSR